MLSVYMLRQFRPYVRLSVTCVDCIKTAEYIIKILSLSDRIILLVFRHQGSLRKYDGFTANSPNTRVKGSDFQPMRLYLGNSTR